MPQAYPQQRNFPGKPLNERDTDSRLLGTARPGRYYDAFGLELLDLVEADLIVSADQQLLTELTEVLRQVVGKGIVVVEEQNHFSALGVRQATRGGVTFVSSRPSRCAGHGGRQRRGFHGPRFAALLPPLWLCSPLPDTHALGSNPQRFPLRLARRRALPWRPGSAKRCRNRDCRRNQCNGSRRGKFLVEWAPARR